MIQGKKNAVGLLIMTILLAGMGAMLLRENSFSRLWAEMSRMNPLLLLAGLAMMTGFVGCEAFCTKQILNSLGHQCSYRHCIGYSFVGFYVSSITPSSTGGQPAQIYYMSQDGIPVAHGALNMMLIAACYQLSSLLWGGGVLLFVPAVRGTLKGGMGLFLLYGAGMMLALTTGMGMLMFRPRFTRRFLRGILTLLTKLRLFRNPKNMQEKLDRLLESYTGAADCVKKHPWLMLRVLVLCLIQQGLLFSIPYVVYVGLGLKGRGWAEIAGVQALLTLAVCNLPLPGAAGAAEGGFLTAFGTIFGSELVAPAMLVSRCISFYAFLLISFAASLAVHLRVCRETRERRLRNLKAGQTGMRTAAVRRYLSVRAEHAK